MATTTILLVGVSSDADFTLTVTLPPASPPTAPVPDLVVKNDAWSKGYAYSASAKKWTTPTLASGSYIVRLDVPATTTPPVVTVTASKPVYFSSHRTHGSSDPISTTRTWQTTTAVTRGDPKDPWPPPGAPYSEEDWFQRALRVANAALPKDGPSPDDAVR